MVAEKQAAARAEAAVKAAAAAARKQAEADEASAHAAVQRRKEAMSAAVPGSTADNETFKAVVEEMVRSAAREEKVGPRSPRYV